MDSVREKELRVIASEIRKDIVRMVGVARSGSIEIPLSITDVLVYLYWEELRGRPEKYQFGERDHFLFGMSGAVPALYAVLARQGYFDREELWHYKRLGAMLQPLPDFRRVPGIGAPCVLSGSELSVASGLAWALRSDRPDYRIFCLVGKEDCETPDFWSEAADISAKLLTGIILLIIIPRNIEKSEKETVAGYADKFVENGWAVSFADGHDFIDMEKKWRAEDTEKIILKAVFISAQIGKGLSKTASRKTGKIKYPEPLGIQEMDRALEELENGC